MVWHSENKGLWVSMRREEGLGFGAMNSHQEWNTFHLLPPKTPNSVMEFECRQLDGTLEREDEKRVSFFLFTEASQEPELEPGLWSWTKQNQLLVSSLTASSCKDFGTWRGSLTLCKPAERIMIVKTPDRMAGILKGGVGCWMYLIILFLYVKLSGKDLI